jgi:hypothetical protein
MSITAEKILRAKVEFEGKSNAGDQLDGIFKQLKKRPLAHSDFESAKSIATLIANGTAEKLFDFTNDNFEENKNLHPRDRELKFIHSYMSTFLGDENKGQLIVVFDRLRVTWRDCFRVVRAAPICIDSNSIEFDHIRNTAEVLRYHSDNFMNAALLALPLCQAMAPLISDETPQIPVAIPHSHGLFLGSAVKTLPSDVQDLTVSWHATRSPTRHHSKVSAGTRGSLTFGAALSLDKSVGFREFVSDVGHNLAYELFSPFFENPRQKERLHLGLDLFSWGSRHKDLVSDSARAAWNEVCKDVRDAVDILIAEQSVFDWHQINAQRKVFNLSQA